MNKRYYVTVEFAVEAANLQRAELMVARRISDQLGTSPVVCEECGHTTPRPGGNPRARVFVEATTDPAESTLVDGPAMLVEQHGLQPVSAAEGGQ